MRSFPVLLLAQNLIALCNPNPVSMELSAEGSPLLIVLSPRH